MAANTLRIKKLSTALSLFLAVFFISLSLGAQHETTEQHEKIKEREFNANKMIIHHVSDAHEIHFVGEDRDGSSIAIYLPVILKTNQGWEFFSSSNFYHNLQATEDEHGEVIEFYKYKNFILLHEHIYYANSEGGLTLEHGHALNEKPFDISVTKNVFGVFLAIFLLMLILRATVKGYTKNKGHAPKGIQAFLEPLILFIRDDIALPSFGHDKARTEKFMPFLLSLFFFIWIANMIGLIPFIGGFNITGTISITLVLAAFVFIYTMIKGNKSYWTHILWPPGVPVFVKPILVPIEIASIFIKPTVLMVRLTANIMAGHIIILAFISLILIFGAQSALVGYSVGVGSTLFMVFMYFIELLVAFLQAYVFTLLTSIYLGDATQTAKH
jgi:F-type H+-transporting ATPase subunit a